MLLDESIRMKNMYFFLKKNIYYVVSIFFLFKLLCFGKSLRNICILVCWLTWLWFELTGQSSLQLIYSKFYTYVRYRVGWTDYMIILECCKRSEKLEVQSRFVLCEPCWDYEAVKQWQIGFKIDPLTAVTDAL